MKLCNIFTVATVFAIPTSLQAQQVNDALRRTIEPVYQQWRSAMVEKNYVRWQIATAKNRQLTIYNRIISEKKPFPATLFRLPTAPPSLAGLRPVSVNMKGGTAVAAYYGKVNFGVGGKPTDNLMLLHFVGEGRAWKFDKAEYVNLAALPDVRKQMNAGDYSYAAGSDFKATGVAPKIPVQLTKMGYIAKVYVFSPGREVKLDINSGRSKHRFQNDKRAEVIIGGAKDGLNKLSFTTKSLPGSTGKEPLDIRVFLMSQTQGVKPVSVFQYRITGADIKAGKKPLASKATSFTVTDGAVKRLQIK